MAQDIVIGGRLHSAATGNTVAGANEILDDAKGKKQNVINQEVDNEIGTDATAGTIKGRIKELENAVGDGGSVDERIAESAATVKSEITGDAASDYNTLGKVEDKIQAEASRAEAAEGALEDADAALDAAKANKATTLEGYGITDAYTKSETYTKTEVNGLVDTPHQNYVTVLTYAALLAIDPGSTDTIYRVSNYDGSVPQVDVTKYSEYAWDGTQYVFLCVKSQIDEVFDISVYNNNATYADLAAALGTGGANVPSTLRRGGMSVKFVQSSDNKYVQYRYMSTSTTNASIANVANWRNDDDGFKVNIIISSLTSNKNLYTGIEDDVKKYINPNNGSITSTTYAIRVSKLIYVKGLENITISRKLSGWGSTTGYRFLDYDLNIVSYGAEGGAVLRQTISVPQDAVFFQFSIDAYTDSELVQVENGTEATEYVQHTLLYTNEINKYFLDVLYESYKFPNGRVELLSLPNNRNIYDGKRVSRYYIDSSATGHIAATTYDLFLSTLIPISNKYRGLVVSKSSAFGNNGKYNFYDKDRVFISGGAFPITYTRRYINIPDNAVYFQFSLEDSSSVVQVEYGTTATEYIAFESAGSISKYLSEYYQDYIFDLAVNKSKMFGEYTLINRMYRCRLPKGKNIWDGTKIDNYYIETNGSISSTTYDFILSGEIPVSGQFGNIVVSNNGSTALSNNSYGRFLDKNHNYIANTAKPLKNSPIEIPLGAAYFQFACENAGQVQVEYGKSMSAYEAFEEGTIFDYINNINTNLLLNEFETKGLVEVIDSVVGTEKGYFRKSIMNFEEHNDYRHTGFIRVFTGDIVESYTNYDNVYVVGIQFFDTRLIPITDSQTGSRKVASQDGYVVVSFISTTIPSWMAKIYRQNSRNVILSCFEEQSNKDTARLSVTKKSSLSKNGELALLSVPQVKNWYQLSAYFKIPNGMQRVRLSRGDINYSRGKVEIDGTNVYEYADNNGNVTTTAHGLTIVDFVVIRVYVSAVFHKAVLTICTNAASIYSKEIEWNGCFDVPRFRNLGSESEESNNITDVELCFGATCFDKHVWIFADSYSDMWPNYLYTNGYNNFLLDGQSGRNAQEALSSLKRGLVFGKPETIIWAMGMNNPDDAETESINEGYEQSFVELCSICHKYDIELRPCTIPNTPTRTNAYKNTLIRSTFFNYIDVAKCVGASEIGSSWFSGLLSGDNVHPSTKGSMVIAECLLNSVGKIRFHNSTE